MSLFREKCIDFGLNLWGGIQQLGFYWTKYECASLAAAVSFYAAVSLFPLLIILVSGLGIFLRFYDTGRDAKADVLQAVRETLSPQMADALASVIEGIQSKALVSGPIALVGFLFVAVLALTQVVQGFNRIWEARENRDSGLWKSALAFVLDRLRSLVLLCGLGGLVILVAVGGVVLHGVADFAQTYFPEADGWGGPSPILLSLPINTLAFATVYRFLSKGPVTWKDSLIGGLFSASLWEAGRHVLSAIVIGHRYTAYGVIGSFLAILVWIYYAMMVLFLGALVVKMRVEREG